MVDRVQYLSNAVQYRVFDALYDLAIKLPCKRYESVTTTHPTTTTFTDSTLLQSSADGLFTNGTVLFWWYASGMAHHSKQVTDHTGNTITFTPAESDLPVGTGYAIFDGSFPRFILIQAIGLALRDFGDIPVTSELTTVEDQEEYDYRDIASIFTGNQVISVEIASQLSPPYEYYTHRNWTVKQNSANGTTLCFDPGHIPDGGYNMRITYWRKHMDILGYETGEPPTWAMQEALEIAPVLNPERLSWSAAVYALRWRASLSPDTPKYKEALQEAVQRAELYRMKYPIERPVNIHLSNWQVGR